MVKKNILYASISAVIMLLFPLCAVRFVNGDAGMAICFILFFAVNPIAAVFIGIATGRNMRIHWFQPLLLSVLFILGTWIFFDMGERAFLIYGTAYLVIGYVSALLTAFYTKKKCKRNER